MEIAGRNVLRHSVDEYQNRQYFDLTATSFMVVLESKGYATFVVAQNPSFGNHGTFGIAAGIPYRAFTVLQRRSDKNMPPLLADMTQQQIDINAAGGVRTQFAAEQRIFSVCLANSFDDVELPFHTQQWSRNQVSVGGIDPAIRGKMKTSGCNHNVKMHIPFQVTSKRVNDSQESGRKSRYFAATLTPSTGFLTIGQWGPLGQTQNGIRNRTKQYVHQNLPVVLNQESQLPGQRKHQMPISHIQHFRQQFAAPLVRASFAATGTKYRLAAVRHDSDRSAFRTAKKMQSQCKRTTQQHLAYVLNDRPTYTPALPGNVAAKIALMTQNIRDPDLAFPRRSHDHKIPPVPETNTSSHPFTRSVGTESAECLYALRHIICQ